MTASLIERDVRDGVALLALNRPAQRNALSRPLLGALVAAVAEAEGEPSVSIVVLAANGPSFCSGIDLTEPPPKDIGLLYRDGIGDRECVARCRKPVIAAVQGAAIGAGFELALSCDVIVAADDARFALPEVSMGGLPGAGGTQRLARLAGRGRAMEICLSGRRVDAAEAARIGIASAVVPAGELREAALAFARGAARGKPVALMMLKEAVTSADEMSLAAGLRHERLLAYAALGADA